MTENRAVTVLKAERAPAARPRRRRERHGASRVRGSCAPSRTGATAAPCGRSTSRTCRSPMRRSRSRPAPPTTEARFELPIEIRNEHRPHRDPRRGLGRRRRPPRRARQAPARRARLRRHDRPGAAALGAELLPVARALALCRGARGPRRRRRFGVAASRRAGLGARSSPTSARSTARRSPRSRPSSSAAACSCASPARGSPPATTTSCRCGCAAAGATSAARSSWDTPRTFAPFTRESPFFGLPIPADLGVRRQILAEPDGDLAEQDLGGARRTARRSSPPASAARGLLVLFHVTADTTWSNLPLSGLFVDMLRRVVGARRRRGRSRRRGPQRRRPDGRAAARARRLRLLSSRRRRPPVRSRADHAERATDEHPPGFYGPVDSSLAVNALATGDKLAPLDLKPLNALIAPLAGAKTIDLRAPLFTAALLALLVDTLASLWLSGHLANLFGRMRRAGSAAAILLAALAVLVAADARAQERAPAPPPLSQDSLQSALVTRLRLCRHRRRPDRRDEQGRAYRA